MLGRHSFLAVSGVTDSGKSHEYAETFERGSAVPSSESHGGTIVAFLRQTGSTVSQGHTEWTLNPGRARSSASHSMLPVQSSDCCPVGAVGRRFTSHCGQNPRASRVQRGPVMRCQESRTACLAFSHVNLDVPLARSQSRISSGSACSNV